MQASLVDVSERAHPVAQAFEGRPRLIGENANAPHPPALLRARRERPRNRRAAEQRDELASFHCPLAPVLPKQGIARLVTAALRDFRPLYVCFGSEADITRSPSHVRFAPESGHARSRYAPVEAPYSKNRPAPPSRPSKRVGLPSERKAPSTSSYNNFGHAIPRNPPQFCAANQTCDTARFEYGAIDGSEINRRGLPAAEALLEAVDRLARAR